MPRAAPRVDPLLHDALGRIAKRRVSPADACRRIGALAEEHGLTRPSYQTVRVLLHEHRRREVERLPLEGVTVEIGATRAPKRSFLRRLARPPALHVTVCYMRGKPPAR